MGPGWYTSAVSDEKVLGNGFHGASHPALPVGDTGFPCLASPYWIPIVFRLYQGSGSPFWPLTPCSTSFPITCDFPDFDPHTMIPFHYPVISLPIRVRASWLQVEARVSLERPAMGSGWGQDFSDGGASFLQDEFIDLSWTCPLLNVFIFPYICLWWLLLLLLLFITIIIINKERWGLNPGPHAHQACTL